MCFDFDGRPPIDPIAGGAIDSTELTLTAADGNRFAAFLARPAEPTGAGIIVLPDVRGLHAYYEELAMRFSEIGVRALAIDYFGRTAGVGRRGPGFDFQAHVPKTTFEGLSADVAAAASYLRGPEGGAVTSLFTIGFCFGGRLAYLTATLGLELAGVIGFYGWPVGAARNSSPAPAEVADRMASPVLAIFGGADEGISPSAVQTFEASLRSAGVDHEVIVYPGAPHSFFDRKADEFAATSEKAWGVVREFVAARTAAGQAAR